MKLLTLYVTRQDATKHLAMVACLEYEDIPYSIQVDPVTVMRLSKGRCNPANGAILVVGDDEVITDHYALMKFIEDKGLRQM